MGKARQSLSKYSFSRPGSTSDLFLLFFYAKGIISWPWIEVREENEFFFPKKSAYTQFINSSDKKQITLLFSPIQELFLKYQSLECSGFRKID